MNTGDWTEQAISLIRQAALAPSSHNTQPWLFRISPLIIDVHADRMRALPVNDPEDRELAISCGCALMNLRIGGAAIGLRTQVQLLPETNEPDWLARASFASGPQETSGEAALSAFIKHRRTYRKRFAPREVDPIAIDQLIEAANIEGVWLRTLLTVERQQVAHLVAEGDAAQWANPSWRRELAAWMHPRRSGDGLTVPALAAPVAQLVVRTLTWAAALGRRTRTSLRRRPCSRFLGLSVTSRAIGFWRVRRCNASC